MFLYHIFSSCVVIYELPVAVVIAEMLFCNSP